MVAPARTLDHLLVEAGNSLLKPPNTIHGLLQVLDQVESILSRVEQTPSEAMNATLSLSMKALVSDDLLRHQDVDVKVAVASCISEIIRITAPDAPYNDEQMKDIFQLIVSSLENISDKSSRSYPKRTSILDLLAKVRSCVIMLDLECDGLIVEMFQLFLKAVRDHHPDNVFSSMEKIMTVVLDESEDASELIFPILASVKKGNEEVLPIARKLGERVLQNCATKLKPYLVHIFKHMDYSSDDYSKVVASICYGPANAVASHDNNACSKEQTEESLVTKASSVQPAQVAKIQLVGEAPNEAVLVTGVVAESCSEGNARSLDPESSQVDCTHHADQSVDTYVGSISEPARSGGGKLVMQVSTSEQRSQEREAEPGSLISSKEPPLSSQVENDKEGEEILDRQENHIHNVSDSPFEEPNDKVAEPSKNEKLDIQLSSSKAFDCEPMNVASPTRDILDSLPIKAGEAKKIENLIGEGEVPSPLISKDVSEGTSDSEEKLLQLRKETRTGHSTEKTLLLTSDSNTEPLKSCGSKIPARDNVKGKFLVKKKKGKKSRGRRKGCSKKVGAKNSANEDDGEMVASPKSPTALSGDACQFDQTSMTTSKRKRVPGKDIEMVPLPKSLSLLSGDACQLGQTPKATSKRKCVREKDSETVTPASSPSNFGGDQLDQTPKTTSSRKSARGEDTGKVPSPESPPESAGDACQLDQPEMTTSRGKRMLEKDSTMPSPKSPSESGVKECQLDQTPKTTLKRKRVHGKDSASDVIKSADNLIGLKIKVWWPADKMFYEGVIDSFDPTEKKHEVLYTDGDVETLNLEEEKWEFLNITDGEQLTASENPDPSRATHREKKTRANSEPSAKRGKIQNSRSTRVRGVSSSKLKGSATRSGSNNAVVRNVRKNKKASNSGGRSEDDGENSMDGFVRRSTRCVGNASKTSVKSKTVDATTPKASTKRKRDGPPTATRVTRNSTSKDTPENAGNEAPITRNKSKGKASKNGKKVNSSSRAGRENLADMVKTPPPSGKANQSKETGKKKGKKRRRGARS